MQDFLFTLEDSGLGQMISGSLWGYPIFLSLHALGMGVVVGISMMFALRVIGLANAVPVLSIAPYWRLALAGFTVNLLSGTALFFGNASSLGANWAFFSKIGMLVVSLFLTFRMVRICINGDGVTTRGHIALAVVAMMCWVATLVFGRLIGYIF